uniref:AAA_8 domain-containing protein n=1 Tax=Steinernema glaseri TaxID=37863 RepID=A0A1I7YH92_9BILA
MLSEMKEQGGKQLVPERLMQNMSEEKVLVLCTAPDLRRQITNEVLEEYYKTLTTALEGDVPFTFDQVKELYKLNFHAQCFNVMFTVVYLPAMNAHLSEPDQQVQNKKFFRRAQLAMDDAIALLDDLPDKFARLSVRKCGDI